MTENLITLIALIAGLVALVRYARHDAFAGASLRFRPHDELGYRDSAFIGRPA
ncbi:MAG TPA: hypothetical protein VFK52_04200 [Nocardioidaceae bacterium]|nr:hypothetical protein [Nocardioidaceae bacterium]